VCAANTNKTEQHGLDPQLNSHNPGLSPTQHINNDCLLDEELGELIDVIS